MASTLKKVFRSYVVDGLLLVALGVAMLLWPDGSLKGIRTRKGTTVDLTWKDGQMTYRER